MSNEELIKYLPALGDRLAVKSLCGDGSCKKKHTLFEKLKERMKIGNPKTSDEIDHPVARKEKKMIGNTRAAKPNRKIELGWIHHGKQVRQKSGGGTRKLTVPKETTKDDLLSMAKDLFFS